MVGLEPGSLNRRVTIQAVTQGVGTSRFPTETPSTLATVWMSRRDGQGGEHFRGQQLSASLPTVWQMHYREDMDPEVVDVPKARRLSYQGRRYDITGASVIGQRAGIELVTLAKVG